MRHPPSTRDSLRRCPSTTHLAHGTTTASFRPPRWSRWSPARSSPPARPAPPAGCRERRVAEMTIGPTPPKTEPATPPPRDDAAPAPAARPTTPRKPARAPLTNRLAVNIVIGVFVIYTLGPVLWLFFAAASDADALSAAEVFNLKDRKRVV